MTPTGKLGVGGIVLALLTTASLLPIGPAAAATPAVFAVGSSVTVRPGAAHAVPVDLRKNSADIAAARNEFESVQVIVEAGDVPLNDVEVSLGDDTGLIGPGGETIPASNVTIYRVGNYTVPADWASDQDGGAGRWPDPLIPTVDPYYGQERNAFPHDVPASERMAAWVDFLVPQGQAAGQYNGSFRVTTAAGHLATIPIRLKVLDVNMPSTPTMDTAFLIQDNTSICKAHTNVWNCGNEEKRWALHSLYGRAALENRFTISNIAPLGQDEGPPSAEPNATRFNKYILPLIAGTNPTSPPGTVATGSWTPIRLPGAKVTTQSVYGYNPWHCLETCVDEWESFAQAKGYKDRLWLYACDEPGASATKWERCRSVPQDAGPNKVGGLAKQTSLRKLVTAHPQRAKDNGALDKIDTIVTNIREITGKTHCCNDWFEGNQRALPIYNEFLADDAGTPDDRIWIYTACDAVACQDPPYVPNSADPTFAAQLYEDWGSYVVDRKDTHTRVMGWLVYAYDATGELFYEVVQKLRTSWTDVFYKGGQGDGTLFYPGIAQADTGGDAGAPIIGGFDDIPIESIRIKEIRDSREEFELLHKLDVAGRTPQAQAIVEDLFGSAATDTWNDLQTKAAWTTPTPADVHAARCAALSELTGTAACSWDDVPPGVSIADQSATEGDVGTTDFQFTVTRTGDVDSAGSVDYTTTAQTATEGVDYADATGTIPFGAGETTKVISVPVFGDTVDEPNETFRVDLSTPVGVTLADASAIGTIVDDDDAEVTYRPDVLIKKKGTKSFKGNDIWNTTGRFQVVSQKIRASKTRSFVLKVQNDGSVAEPFSIAEVRPAKLARFKARYFAGAKEITGPVRRGTYSTGTIAPGRAKRLLLEIRAPNRVKRGIAKVWKVHAVSLGENPWPRDVVKAKVRVPK